MGTYLEVTYLFTINFCSAWICLLIDAINATIDFRTSAFETAPSVTVYEAVADVVTEPVKDTTALNVPAVVI